MNTILLRECKSTAEETEKKKGAAGDHHGQEKVSSHPYRIRRVLWSNV
jgi:hypothetical protein